MTPNDLVELNLTLPRRTARALLEFLESVQGSGTATPSSSALTTPQADLALLTRGEKPGLVVETFVKNNGVLFNRDLAIALGTESRPQLTTSSPIR